ncbi:MAG: hypothetical protein H6677_00080 [Candidatus Obscuribacterales bacterium]|nr:hypothetical protein [Cyanobacteria bacterium HKST-UBA01]MCB9466636.1 hypothetical protein [Candidatus Obscuribacterales bacterium]
MSDRLKNVARIQFSLFLLPLVFLLWAWFLYLSYITVSGMLITGGLTASALTFNLLALGIFLVFALPLSWLEFRLAKRCIHNYSMKDISVNLIVFLFICGTVSVGFSQNFIPNLPTFIDEAI